jgi:hypothetical protein
VGILPGKVARHMSNEIKTDDDIRAAIGKIVQLNDLVKPWWPISEKMIEKAFGFHRIRSGVYQFSAVEAVGMSMSKGGVKTGWGVKTYPVDLAEKSIWFLMPYRATGPRNFLPGQYSRP